MKKEERKNRVIARGEFSGHSHVITGQATVRNERGEILIDIHGPSAIEHLLEEMWVEEEKPVHTKEHEKIDLTDMPNQVRQGDVFLEKIAEKTYKFIQQTVFDPLQQRIVAAGD